MEFKPFPSIKRINNAHMQITQKIHGSNAQILITTEVPGDAEGLLVHVGGINYRVFVGSRTRWIKPDSDNYGFATFVYNNAEEFVNKLGVGQHFGEWAGPGINSGEGLTEKTFVIFDYWKYPAERPLPPQTRVMPVLYTGGMDLSQIELVMQDLKQNGSKLVPGFMRPEGAVISIDGVRYKKVFNAEEIAWTGKDPNYIKKQRLVGPSYDYLCQPVRLEKLLSRDESYRLNYPSNLKTIVEDYWQDLIKEEQATEDIKKPVIGFLFKFIRDTIEVNNE